MKLRYALLAASLFAAPAVASAQVVDGPYVAGGAGFSQPNNTKLTTPPGYTGRLSGSNAGYEAFVSGGYGFGNGLRAEAEILGFGNDQNLSFNTPGGTATGKTTQNAIGVMVNGLYDIDLGMGFTPYVGAGAGYLGVQYRGLNAQTAGATCGVGFVCYYKGNSGTNGAPAIQGIVGVSFPVNPHLSITLDYRLIDKLGGSKESGILSAGTNYVTTSTKVGQTLEHSLMIGLRWAANAYTAPMAPMPAAAPAAVAPAPAPSRSYLVFFDWDKADLTARAQQIIAEAAKNSTRVASTRIDVAGHADKSGTPAYNQTLSLARANNVAAELVRLGVPKSAISISAFGDTKPLVPTAAGVREPQNRRVEIVLR